jgi:hypothetical protein
MSRTAQALNATGVSVVSNAENPKLQRLEGIVLSGTSATQYYLQIFNSAPTTGVTVPLRSLQVLGGTGFTFDYTTGGGLSLDNIPNWASGGGLYVALSTADAVYTNDGSTKMDINVDIEEFEIELQGTTTVGDTVSAVSSLVVYTNPNVNKRLLSLTMSAPVTDQYVMLFAKATPTTGDYPIAQWLVTALAGQIAFKFGNDGKVVTQQGTDGTIYSGCYLYASSTPTTYTAPTQSVTLKAIYK